MEDRRYYYLTKPVFLIGFMGAGKTSVSRKLARLCGVSSVDMDTYLQRREDCKIAEIFESYGEAAFRRIETDVLRELAAKPEPLLISCGGGVVTSPENIDILKASGFVVYLNVTADEARARIHNMSARPLFTDIENARARNVERRPLYEAAADATVNTGSKSVGRLAHEVKDILEKEGILCPRPE